MKQFLMRAALCLALGSSAVNAGELRNANKYKTDFPPPVELNYKIEARQKGIPVEGTARVRWNATADSFSIETETRVALFGKIMEASTDGTFDEFGLAPRQFREKRLGKRVTVTSFDRGTDTIQFSASDATYPINGGEQDRNSIVWQLVAVARANPARFKPGSEWTFTVAGQRDADTWTFMVVRSEHVRTPAGAFETLLVTREPEDGKGQQLHIWLAPERGWLPVRLRFADDNGDQIEQTLQKSAALT